ncbi:MAG: HAD-IC family P-type ATPase, partial [Lachnospira sp.]|nr:HAD-IC family P-type ATPase [Lachnospira sp.]
MDYTNKDTGLTTKRAEQLAKAGLSNLGIKNQSKSIPQIIADNVFTYFNLIFAIFAGLLILVKSYINMTFLPIVIINSLIGIIQEIRTKLVLDKLTLLSAPTSRVIRDGKLSEIMSEQLVKGDLCVFEAGDQICADARVATGSVRVNESLVTGESDEIIKLPGDSLLSGSFVASGSCRAVLTNVGLDSYVSRLAVEAKASRGKQQTDMMRSLDRLVKIIGIVIIPIGILMFVQNYFFLGAGLQQSVVAVIAALVGMIPEGLYLLASVALVVSVLRLGKKNVLVHEMPCVETLARVNVLCVDKTGTITENKMSVADIIPLNADEGNKSEDFPGDSNVHEMIGNLVAALNCDNATIEALKEYFTREPSMAAETIYGFSSETKYSGAVMYDGNNLVLGAPEKLLLEDYPLYKDEIVSLSSRGFRVLVFGVYEGFLDGKPLLRPVKPLAIVTLWNAIRPEARATFQYFKDQGVDIKVISGDNPVTVSYVARSAGIAGADSYVDATELVTEADFARAVKQYTVFGRVSPEQKRKLVNAIKADGNVVAMTGDGVNDVLALKDADCSIAFGSGSDAACNAAQIVLVDSDFACMPSVVAEGRRVVNNIQRTASLFLVKNIFSMMLSVFSLFTGNVYPLYPTQLSLLGAFTIGAPGFLLALQPSHSRITGRFLRNVCVKALPAALTDFILVAVYTV